MRLNNSGRRIRTTGLAVVTEMGKEDASDTAGETGVSGDQINAGGTYGAAIEVPEMVLEAVVDPIQAEVTSTPRNQTGKVSGWTAVWCGEMKRTFEGPTKVGEGRLDMIRVNCSWII